jgi:hypothetical protein
MERFGKITFEDREFEGVPGEPREYRYQHHYHLQIELTEDFLYSGDEFLGIKPLLNVTFSHVKHYQRSGKVLSDDLADEYMKLEMDDPGDGRLSVVRQKLSCYLEQYPWLDKLFKLM